MTARRALFALLFAGSMSCAAGETDTGEDLSGSSPRRDAGAPDGPATSVVPPSDPKDGGNAGNAEDGVTVTLAGSGTGTVVSNPSGVSCPGDCSEGFTAGTTVTLTATPDEGSDFTGWSGGGCSGNATCLVTANGQVGVTATFTKMEHTLTVIKAGTGAGSVTSSPVGIDCGTTCNASYGYGTSVTLTAVPAGGSTFAGWSGAGCTGTAGCTVSMTASRAAIATFTSSSACTLVNNASSCSNATIAQIVLGKISAASCQSQCKTQLTSAGVTKGCWILALDDNCYCRGGVLTTGGTRPGGTCN